MGKNRDDKNDDDKPGRHDANREGHVHQETAEKLDPSEYDTYDDDDDD